ncbi:MAG: hypothetical protein Q4C87_00450 [Actinomycetaceae bacterium]|nr:hypothetical protein [Actinomycetaceae bacterium]
MTAHPSVDQRRLRAWLLDIDPDLEADDDGTIVFRIFGVGMIATIVKGGYVVIGANCALPNDQESINPLEIISAVSNEAPAPKMSLDVIDGQPVLRCSSVNYIEAGCNDAQGIAMVKIMASVIADAIRAVMDRWPEVEGA